MPLAHYNTSLTIGGSLVVDMTDITLPNFSRESVATHSLDDRDMTFRPSYVNDWGEIGFSVMYASGSHASLLTLSTSTSNSHFVAANNGSTLLNFSGHITSFEFDDVNRDDEDNIMASFTAKVSGPVLFS